ncbi:hypothetical protein [Paludisphaera rhizosphaerae]|uniref:hypothetical protein n=1 Tax=Paludisphaera rhizosphaerae TaxID=2711216 RepID=UPI0013EA273F|nr:hypothetical protein [Paludisphaera rhizosphaerae]
MPLLVLLLQLFILAVAVAVMAFLLFALTLAAICLLTTAYVLNRLGWDRRLIAFLATKAGVRVSPPVKARFDDMDAPIEGHWILEDPRAGRPG